MDKSLMRQTRGAERFVFRATVDRPDALALARAQEAEGATFVSEFVEPCGVCRLPYHPDCAACVGGGRTAA